MRESTKKFLSANRRFRQTSMTAYEYCAEGQRCSQALREIREDLCGKLIQFPRDSREDYYILVEIDMVKCSNGSHTYWRAMPNWEEYYVSYNDHQALIQLKEGTYVDGKRAGGQEYDRWIKNVYRLLKKGVIEVK